MAIQAHLAELTAKHRQLEKAIEEELQHQSHDTLKLAQLKKEKLKIKDQIASLENKPH